MKPKIRNKKDLEAEKQRLRKELSLDGTKAAVSATSKLFIGEESNDFLNGDLKAKVEKSLFYGMNLLDEKYKLSKSNQSILGIFIMVLTPILTIKLQELLRIGKKI